jgi:hypothetical protein
MWLTLKIKILKLSERRKYSEKKKRNGIPLDEEDENLGVRYRQLVPSARLPE